MTSIKNMTAEELTAAIGARGDKGATQAMQARLDAMGCVWHEGAVIPSFSPDAPDTSENPTEGAPEGKPADENATPVAQRLLAFVPTLRIIVAALFGYVPKCDGAGNVVSYGGKDFGWYPLPHVGATLTDDGVAQVIAIRQLLGRPSNQRANYCLLTVALSEGTNVDFASAMSTLGKKDFDKLARQLAGKAGTLAQLVARYGKDHNDARSCGVPFTVGDFIASAWNKGEVATLPARWSKAWVNAFNTTMETATETDTVETDASA